MKSLFRLQIELAQSITDDGHRQQYLSSVLRSLLQTTCLCVLDIAWDLADEDNRPIVSKYARRLLASSDGTYAEVLDHLIPIVRAQGWLGFMSGWFSPQPSLARAGREVVLDWLRLRNNRTAHGVVDQASIRESLNILGLTSQLIDILSDALPQKNQTNHNTTVPLLFVRHPRGISNITPYTLHQGNIVMLRTIARRGSTWRAPFQTLDPNNSIQDVLDFSDRCPLIVAASEDDSRMRQSRIPLRSGEWRPSVVLPSRQTSIFEGRQTEMSDLLHWWNDMESRACLVFGEGGIGKTTLVLEFVNRILEGDYPDITWRPELVFFYTTKQTRWTAKGLEILRGAIPGLTDAVRDFSKEISAGLTADWYRIEDADRLIERSATLCSDIGLKRDDILLILDNTENLARSPDEEITLNRHLGVIARRLGRLMLTSRRRERVEAQHIEVHPLSDALSVSLLQRLAANYDVKALQQAGGATLSRVAKRLSGKPLLLDVLARTIGASGQGIDAAISQILAQESGDLGEFLFADAWKRMPDNHRRVFLVLARMGEVHSDSIVKWACAQCDVQVNEWLDAFYETRFGSVRDYSSSFDLLLDHGASRYLLTILSRLHDGVRADIEARVTSISRRYRRLLEASKTHIDDRVSRAFESAAARAAYLAADRGDIEDAIFWYDEATATNPDNAALYDRFAWFLMVNRRYERAAKVARLACQIDPKDADAWFTSGMISARTGEVDYADSALAKAVEYGKPKHLVALQRARARIEAAEQAVLRSHRREYCAQAQHFLREASLGSPQTGFDRRHQAEVMRLQDRVSRLR